MTRVVTTPPSGGLRPDGTCAGGWWHDDPETGRIVCDLCPRACALKPGDRGFCFVRRNVDDQIVLTTHGRSTGFCIDPIEKKPLNHFFPGTSVLSFGTAGCNLGCRFCQNWDISKSREVERLSEDASPEAIAREAERRGCKSVAFTYNDPVIWAEYAIDVARACRERGVKTVAVTAGYVSPAARVPFFRAMDAANVDLKAFAETFYHELTASHLQPVLDTLAWIRAESDCWLEITNLMIPDANDSPDETRRLVDWVLRHCGDDVPVHFTAFHPDYRMRERAPTPHETLLRAYDIALAQGLKYVYTGNVDDVAHQSTYCPGCGKVVIERNWYELGSFHVRDGRCAHCGATIAGRFDDAPGTWGRRRVPIDIPRVAPAPAARIEARAPVLSESRRASILEAAGEYVSSAILVRPASVRDPSLAGAADLTVGGAYVTLKRAGHLRACTGTLGKTSRLGDALRTAAFHTATEDHRLPPISPTELPFLDLSVNLLFGLRRLAVSARERPAAVEPGRHGLRIQRGEAAGLLLPVVATERGWDAETFLRQVCRKAGLPTTAWEDDETTLHVFEAVEFGGPLMPPDDHDARARDRALPAESLRGLVELARANVAALARGMTPTYYVQGLMDGQVAGLALTLEGPALGAEGPRHFTQLSLRPGVPLQATLMALCESAGSSLRERPPGPGSARVGLTVFTDPALHGTLADPDLRGVDSADRALLALEDPKAAWVFDPSETPNGLLARLGDRIAARDPARTGVFSLAARSTENSAAFDNRPRPIRDNSPRPPAVAGTFYPADASSLARQVDHLLAQPHPAPRQFRAAMVPHAGLRFSGKVAAAVLQRIEFPELVFVLGPKHTRSGVDWAVAPCRSWTIPGGEVPSDPAVARALCQAIPGLELDTAAHAREHAIEIELPLLGRLAPRSRVIGIAMGSGDWRNLQRFAEGLAAAIRGLPEPPLLLVSSDMNHFANDAETRVLDEIALRAMESLDPERLLATVTEHEISMCGVKPAVVVMETLRQLGGLTSVERVAHATSADAGADPARVVGYAGVLID